MFGDVGLFVWSLLSTGGLLFLSIYIVITLSDLECDYLNSQECCSKLNKWILWELGFQAIVNISLFLINYHYILFLMNLPITGWLAWRVIRVRDGDFGVYDPLEIHNRGVLKMHMRNSMIRLAFFLIMFFVYLYCLTIEIVTKTHPKTVGAAGEF